MRICILALALIMFFVLLVPSIAFACSNCYNFGNFNANAFVGGNVQFRLFTYTLGPSSIGRTGINFEYRPLIQSYEFRKTDIGNLGIEYKFMMPQPKFDHFHIPDFEYRIPIREIPKAKICFKGIPLRYLPEPCPRCCDQCC